MAGPPGWSLNASPDALLAAMGISRERQRMAARRAGEVLRTKWVETLSGPGRGRLYEAGLRFFTKGGRVIPLRDSSGVQRRRAPHRASARGDAPARDTGASAASIDVDDRNPDALRVGSDEKSLLFLEHGVADHPGGITIAPRPHARRALEAARDEMNRVVHEALKGS